MRRNKTPRKPVDWKSVWPLPLTVDDRSEYVFSNSGTMALMHSYDDDEIRDIVSIINGEREADVNMAGRWTARGCDIYMDDVCRMCVRGWGFMIAMLNMKPESAKVTQDSFIEYILGRLNGGNMSSGN